jgi:hypothetical protein
MLVNEQRNITEKIFFIGGDIDTEVNSRLNCLTIRLSKEEEKLK